MNENVKDLGEYECRSKIQHFHGVFVVILEVGETVVVAIVSVTYRERGQKVNPHSSKNGSENCLKMSCCSVLRSSTFANGSSPSACNSG